MSDKPETLSAILAEMRREERPYGISPDRLRSYADRIEAAVERERAITDIMLAVKDKPLPHPDPDNAPPLFFPMTKTQLQTLSDLVAIAHDEMDGLPRHEQELERFDSLLFDMKARYAFDKPYAASGNAAALRAALKDVLDHAPFATDHATMLTGGNDLLARLRHAYYAPARNCDRFATEDEAREAYWAYREPLEFNNKPFVAITEWLFAEAKGGAE